MIMETRCGPAPEVTLPHSPSEPVAVIMTLYRSDPLDAFELAMQSLEAQSLRAPIRIYLCVDGPLPEASEAWLAQNLERFYRILRNEKNLGLALSLNRLIDNLEDEEFVFRMDGDDISLPGRFEKQIELMRSEPELGLCGCQVVDIDDDGNELAQRPFPTNPQDTGSKLSKLVPVLHPTFCIRRSILRDPSLRYPDAYLCEDLAFLVLFTEAGHQISNHRETLFQWRTGENFFKRRRSVKRGYSEMRWYFRALRNNGSLYSLQAVYPVLRFGMRVIPEKWAASLYKTRLRNATIGVSTQSEKADARQ